MLLYAGARSVGRAFWHRLSGVHELCKRVRPDGAALFLHRPSGALELPQACSPLTGGKVFTEPQRGATPYPRRWAKRKDNLRFSFLFELLPFPCVLIRRRFPICDRCEIGERQSGYLSVTFSAFSQFTDSVLLHRSATSSRRDMIVSRNSLTRYTAWHLRIRRLVQFIFVGAIYHNALTICAALLSPRGPSLALRAIHLVPRSAQSKSPV